MHNLKVQMMRQADDHGASDRSNHIPHYHHAEKQVSSTFDLDLNF